MADTQHDGPDRPKDITKPPSKPASPPSAPTGKPAPPSGTAPQVPPAGTPVTQQVGRVVLIVAAVLFGIFAVFNFQYVDFNWVFGQTEVVQTGGERTSGGIPLIILLLVSFALGALVAWIATVRSERRRRKRGE